MLKTLTVSEFLESNNLDKELPIFWDIETEDLYVNCSLMQLANEDGEIYMVRTDTDSEVSQMVSYLKDKWLVGYNLSYDYGTLGFMSKKVDDLFHASKMAFPQLQQFSLDIVAEYIDPSIYAGLDKKALQKKGFIRKAYLSQMQLRYAQSDIVILRKLWKSDKIQAIIENNLAYRLSIYALEEAMIWQDNGLPLLQDTVTKYMKEAEQKEVSYMTSIRELTGLEINPRSSKQVKEYFGTGSSDKATLTRIAIEGRVTESKGSAFVARVNAQKAQEFDKTKQAVAEAILGARKAKNDISKLSSYVGQEKMYGRFKPIGASTSRWTCSGTTKGSSRPELFNAQNYSRDFKAVFGVKPDSGLIIVAADYATLEIRIAACMMGEENMYKALMEGVDIHKATASMLFDKPVEEVHGKERSNAKVSNFGLAA